jgi:hypothetical protein
LVGFSLVRNSAVGLVHIARSGLPVPGGVSFNG